MREAATPAYSVTIIEREDATKVELRPYERDRIRPLLRLNRFFVVIGLAWALLNATTFICIAQSPQRNIPTPPSRPADLKPSSPAPDQSVETKATSTNLQKPPAELIIPTLPTATRARMQECGIEWNEMKKKGSAAEKTWRDFAMKCLAR